MCSNWPCICVGFGPVAWGSSGYFAKPALCEAHQHVIYPVKPITPTSLLTNVTSLVIGHSMPSARNYATLSKTNICDTAIVGIALIIDNATTVVATRVAAKGVVVTLDGCAASNYYPPRCASVSLVLTGVRQLPMPALAFPKKTHEVKRVHIIPGPLPSTAATFMFDGTYYFSNAGTEATSELDISVSFHYE